MKKKRIIIISTVLVLVFGLTFAWDVMKWVMTQKFIANYQPPPVTISTQLAKTQTWHPKLSAVGSFQAINSVDVTTQLSGMVTNIFFRSGEMVKKNQPLVQLDDRADQEILKMNQAKLLLDQLNYQRQKNLYRTRSTAKSELDKAEANLTQAQAAVAQAQVTIDRKLIKAPFAGKIGIRQVNLGEFINPGQALVSLQSMNPLYVDFTLPGSDLPLLFTGQTVVIHIDAYPKAEFTGKIVAINSTVNVNTRTILVRTLVSNEKNQLYPGLYADVSVILPVENNVVTVPQTAIDYSLYGDSIYVVTKMPVSKKHDEQKTKKAKDKTTQKTRQIYVVHRRFIVPGDRQGTVVAITQGLKAGEVVVTSGQLKLRNGSRVYINNQVKL